MKNKTKHDAMWGIKKSSKTLKNQGGFSRPQESIRVGTQTEIDFKKKRRARGEKYRKKSPPP